MDRCQGVWGQYSLSTLRAGHVGSPPTKSGSRMFNLIVWIVIDVGMFHAGQNQMARTVHQKSVLLTLVVAAMAAELRKPGAQGPEDLEPSAGEALRDRLNAGFDRVVGGHEVETEPPILLDELGAVLLV